MGLRDLRTYLRLTLDRLIAPHAARTREAQLVGRPAYFPRAFGGIFKSPLGTPETHRHLCVHALAGAGASSLSICCVRCSTREPWLRSLPPSSSLPPPLFLDAWRGDTKYKTSSVLDVTCLAAMGKALSSEHTARVDNPRERRFLVVIRVASVHGVHSRSAPVHVGCIQGQHATAIRV